jgi:flavin reductase (DIM6/NTAB) family NADH-FMN oxidoreductase RutF
LILVCIGHEASVIEYFRTAAHFGISVLGEEQKPLSDRFARKGHDRFDRVAWHPGATGVPLLDGVICTIECAIVQRVTSGDHDLFIGEVVRTHVRTGRPLLYFDGRYRALG